MHYEILGGLRVLRGEAPVTLGGPKAQRLFAALLVDAPRAVERDVLVERLWGDQPPATMRTALQVLVSHLRRTLERDQRGVARSVP
jgi:DNA-binding SARP family transcriptional activator